MNAHFAHGLAALAAAQKRSYSHRRTTAKWSVRRKLRHGTRGFSGSIWKVCMLCMRVPQPGGPPQSSMPILGRHHLHSGAFDSDSMGNQIWVINNRTLCCTGAQLTTCPQLAWWIMGRYQGAEKDFWFQNTFSGFETCEVIHVAVCFLVTGWLG